VSCRIHGPAPTSRLQHGLALKKRLDRASVQIGGGRGATIRLQAALIGLGCPLLLGGGSFGRATD